MIAHIGKLIKEYINGWRECEACGMMCNDEVVAYQVHDGVLCNDCYEENLDIIALKFEIEKPN